MTAFTGTALDAARHNLAWAKEHGKDAATIAHLEANVVRASDSLGPMGQITTWMLEYQAGTIDKPTLVENLAGFDYATPTRFTGIPEDIYEAEAQAEERTYDDEDTMDEVEAGLARGLIDSDLLLEIVGAIEDRHT